MKSVVGSLVATAAIAKMPNGVSDEIYDCTFNENDIKLGISVNGRSEVVCGDENGEAKVYNSEDFPAAPIITLKGGLKEDALYTYFLSNPDWIIPVGPIIHNAVGNIKGSDFKSGNVSGGDVIFDFFKPNPPVPALNFHYCYVVFEQSNGEIDFSDVKSLETEKFPLREVVEQHGLSLVTSNYFVAEWKVLAQSSFLQ